jgi:predicted alpha/beta hydrolase family esterase
VDARFLILHGWQGSGPDHWQTWLADRLAGAGHPVRYPELPDPEAPHPIRWTQALRRELHALGPGAGSTVVCHSLACVLWLRHALTAPPAMRVDRVLLVAPPGPRVRIPEVLAFFPITLDARAARAAAGETRLVCGDDDPYCPSDAAVLYADPLRVPVDVVHGGGHLNPDAGYGAWPEVEDWCLGRAGAVYGAKKGVDT